MRLICTIPFALLLAGCSIQSNVPDYEYPAESDVSGNVWPNLAITSELESAGSSVQEKAENSQAEADRLASRARALRDRAARLRRQTQN